MIPCLPLSSGGAEVLTFTGSGSMSWDGVLEADGSDDYHSWDAGSIAMSEWDGTSAFSGSINDSVSHEGATLDLAATMTASIATSDSTTTFSYAESWQASGSGLADMFSGDSAQSIFAFTFVTDGSMLLTWDGSGYLMDAGFISYSGNGMIAQGPEEGVDFSGRVLGTGVNDVRSILLSAGTHTIGFDQALQHIAESAADGPYEELTQFDLVFSNVIPGPSAMAAILTMGLARRRRSRA